MDDPLKNSVDNVDRIIDPVDILCKKMVEWVKSN